MSEKVDPKTAKAVKRSAKTKDKKTSAKKKKKNKADKGATPTQTRIRYAAVAVYVAVVILGFFWSFQPRLFWTIALPIIPFAIVLMGFHNWRRICPLAFWGELGLKAKKSEVKRVPKWLEANFFLVTFGFLMTMMWARLMLNNGDGMMLSFTLIGLAAAAAFTNFHYTGKTWCNFICPVGMVERIYTEPNSLPMSERNSQCVKCTACKKNCPDIDQENAYWKDVDTPARRIAYFAFPGLVVAFYTYYYLRVGSWSYREGAYFNGTWTNTNNTNYIEHIFTGNGFFFAPWVPPIVASILTLAGFSAISYLLFDLFERKILIRFKPEDEERRHIALTTAAFTAFNLFYLWAGAPSILKADKLLGGPFLTRLIAFGIPVVATLFLLKRYRHSKASYLQEKSAKKLLRKWTFDEPPPKDPGEIFAFFKAQESAHEVQLAAYRETVQEVLADGLVTDDEVRLLDQLREQLNITEKEHRKIFKELSDEQRGLFEAEKTMSVEKRLQLEGYKVALSMVLMRDPSKSEIESLRLEYGIEKDDHDTVLAELRGESSPVLARVERTFNQIDALRDKLLTLAPMSQSGEFAFLIFVLLKQQDSLVDRIIDALVLYSEEGERVHELRAPLFVSDKDTRKSTLDELRTLSDGSLIDRLEPIIMRRRPKGGKINQQHLKELLLEMLQSSDIYKRAGALFAAGQLHDPSFKDALLQGLEDPDVLVRETAIYACLSAQEILDSDAVIEPLRRDPEPIVQQAAHDVLEALRSGKKHEFNVQGASETGRFVAPPVPDSRLSSLATFEKILFLRCVPIFADLDPEDLHELSSFTEEVRVEPHELICRQGDTDTDAFVIVTGRAVVLIEREGEEAMEVATLGPGDVLGELAAIDGHSRSATVQPRHTSAVRLLRIPGDTFRNRLAIRPDVAPMIMSTLTTRLRDTLSQVRGGIRDAVDEGQVSPEGVTLLDRLALILEDEQITDSEQRLYDDLRTLVREAQEPQQPQG